MGGREDGTPIPEKSGVYGAIDVRKAADVAKEVFAYVGIGGKKDEVL